MPIEMHMNHPSNRIEGPYQELPEEEHSPGLWGNSWTQQGQPPARLQEIHESDVSSEYSGSEGAEPPHDFHEIRTNNHNSMESLNKTYKQQDETALEYQRKARDLLRRAQQKLEMIASELRNHRKDKPENATVVEESA
uniref:Uncharacterized protein n=1 Tax=Bionectria ochroleuca TaxID=29856 RepID=A0A8H7K732_BIOOC